MLALLKKISNKHEGIDVVTTRKQVDKLCIESRSYVGHPKSVFASQRFPIYYAVYEKHSVPETLS